MFMEIEKLLLECSYLFSRVKRLALARGIDPTNRWFKCQIGTTEMLMRRSALIGELSPSETFQFVYGVKQELLSLIAKLKKVGGDEDPTFEIERNTSPRRRELRRDRELF